MTIDAEPLIRTNQMLVAVMLFMASGAAGGMNLLQFASPRIDMFGHVAVAREAGVIANHGERLLMTSVAISTDRQVSAGQVPRVPDNIADQAGFAQRLAQIIDEKGDQRNNQEQSGHGQQQRPRPGSLTGSDIIE